MKIQLLSDLHIETQRLGSNNLWQIPEVDADLIVLAGDIHNGPAAVKWACDESSRLNLPTIFVAGNHEHYGFDIDENIKSMRNIAKSSNVRFLECDEWIYDKVRFLGATLWTDYSLNSLLQSNAMSIVEKILNDHKYIKKQDGRFTTQHALDIHRNTIKWLIQRLEDNFCGKTVVITHHAPSYLSQHPVFSLNAMSTAFMSNLNWMIEKYKIELWIHGHTHANVNYEINNTQIVSNQKGYPLESIPGGFDPQLVLSI